MGKGIFKLTSLIFFCKSENEGYNCYAVEDNQSNLYFLKKLKKAESKKFKIISGSLCNFKKNQKIDFDVVLAIDKFQDCFKNKDTYLKLINLLGRLSIKELFLGISNLKKSKSKYFYKNYSHEQILSFVNENSSLSNADFLGKTKDGKHIYKITSHNHFTKLKPPYN